MRLAARPPTRAPPLALPPNLRPAEGSLGALTLVAVSAHQHRRLAVLALEDSLAQSPEDSVPLLVSSWEPCFRLSALADIVIARARVQALRLRERCPLREPPLRLGPRPLATTRRPRPPRRRRGTTGSKRSPPCLRTRLPLSKCVPFAPSVELGPD